MNALRDMFYHIKKNQIHNFFRVRIAELLCLKYDYMLQLCVTDVQNIFFFSKTSKCENGLSPTKSTTKFAEMLSAGAKIATNVHIFIIYLNILCAFHTSCNPNFLHYTSKSTCTLIFIENLINIIS
jgi:hypothetical protein